MVLVTLGGCHLLDGLVACLRREAQMKIVRCSGVAKMASHAIFQYDVLAIDDTHNTWTNMIVKINIPRLLGSNDDKEKIGVVRPEGPPLRGFLFRPKDKNRRGCEEIQYTG